MKICMIAYDIQRFGGLEEYAVNLATALQEQGHETSFLSAAWVEPGNQYRLRLKERGIPLVQPPKWISMLASDWETKERVLRIILRFAGPLIFFLGAVLSLLKRQSFAKSVTSAHNRLRGYLTKRLIGHDRREALARFLLQWWKVRWRPDLLHVHGYTTSLLFVIEWAHQRVPVVYVEHQTPDPKFNWWNGFQRTINKAAFVIAVSEKSAQGLREVCGVTRPIAVIGPLLPDPFASGWTKSNAPNHNDKRISLTTIARLYVTKGLHYLLQTAVLVKAAHPNAEFRVYGGGELRKDLLAEASRLGLDGERIFVGTFATRADLSRIMLETDIFVMPSILEGQPLGLVEAMAYGCPIVATAVGGIPELIDDGINGLLCPAADPEALARKIIALIDDAGLRQRLGIAARESYVRGAFHPQAIISRLLSVYTAAIEEG